MSQLRTPGLGPIVGHTTSTSCKLWIRADDPEDSGTTLAPNRRTVGVIAIYNDDDGKPGPVLTDGHQPAIYYFRVHREQDRCGTFEIGVDRGMGQSTPSVQLTPDTSYHVMIGTLTIDDSAPDEKSVDDNALKDFLPPVTLWQNTLLSLQQSHNSCASFSTFPALMHNKKTVETLSFVVGSCRYPGLFWRHKHSDTIFKPIRDHVHRHDTTDKAETIKFVLMVGDQIYADKASRYLPIGLADTEAEFQERYHSAFGSPNMRALLRRVPHYMILDDHEIEDNWVQDRINKDRRKRELFQTAFFYYTMYQNLHAPKNYGERPYYSFACGGYPFFVLDTRTQRTMNQETNPWDDRPLINPIVEDTGDAALSTQIAAYLNKRTNSRDADNHLLGRPAHDPGHPTQLSRLLTWLQAQQQQVGNAPKCIVSSSVFVPNPVAARVNCSRRAREASDSWPGFPTTRRTILQCMVEHNIQNVIFVSGDIHCSNIARLSFSGSADAEQLKAFSITSSALYWPFPFADGDPAEFVHDSQAEDDTFEIGNGISMDYTASHFTQQDNFCRVDIDQAHNRLTFAAYDKTGQLIQEERVNSDTLPIRAELDLVPW